MRVTSIVVVAVAWCAAPSVAGAADDPTTTVPVTTTPTTAPATTEPPTTAPPTTAAPATTEAPATTAPSTEPSTTPPTTEAPSTTPTTTASTRTPTTRSPTATSRGATPATTAPSPATSAAPGTSVVETAPAPATTQLSSSSISPFTTPRRITTTVVAPATIGEIGPTTEITSSDPSRLASFVIIVLLGLIGAAVSVTSRRARGLAVATAAGPSVLDDLPVGFDFEPVVHPVPVSAMRAEEAAAVVAGVAGGDDDRAAGGDRNGDGSPPDGGDGAGDRENLERRPPDTAGLDQVDQVEQVEEIEQVEEVDAPDGIGPIAASALGDEAVPAKPDRVPSIDLSGPPPTPADVNLRGTLPGGVTELAPAGTMGRPLIEDETAETSGFVLSDSSTARAVSGAPAASEVALVARKKKSEPVRPTGPVSRREVTAVAATGSFASWSELSGSVDAAPPASPVTPDEIQAVERPDAPAPVWIQGVAPVSEPAPEPEGSERHDADTAAVPAPAPEQAAAPRREDDALAEPSGDAATDPPAEVLELAGAIAAAAEEPGDRGVRFDPARAAAAEAEPELAAELRDRTTDETAELLAEQAARVERESSPGTVSGKLGVLPPIVTAADRNPVPDVLSLVAMTPKERRRRSAATDAERATGTEATTADD